MGISLRAMRAGGVAAALLAVAPGAFAESNITVGTGTISASARANIRIEIPRFVFLRVGTGTDLAQNTTVNDIVFQPTVAQIGNSTAVNATAASGDLGNGVATVQVISNGGNITLRGTGSPSLLTNSATGTTIPWSELQVTATNNITHPTIGGANSTFNAVNNVVNLKGTWTYRYANTTTPAGGNYTSTVTYTASTP